MKNLLNSFLIIFVGIFLMSLSKCNSDKKLYYNNLYLIDVNDKDIFNDIKIKGAINLNYENAKKEASNFNKDFKLIFYCSDYFCPTSDLTAEIFYELGFKNLFVYKGGIQEWYQLSLKNPEDYQIEGAAKSKFLNRSIEKPESEKNLEESTIKIISAQDLSKLLKTNINKAA